MATPSCYENHHKHVTPHFLTTRDLCAVCFIQTHTNISLSETFEVCVYVWRRWCGEGVGAGVIFPSDGGEGLWSNVKIITCGGREIECED